MATGIEKSSQNLG
jgi:predicted phosphodiesterase